MNKKTLFLIILLAVSILPVTTLAVGSLPGMVTTLQGQLTATAGGLAIIGFVVAGIMYISATANPGNMSIAKGALVAAIIGTVILIISSQASDFVHGLLGV